MDARHFDALARTLTERGPRRGLLALLATLPLVRCLLALLDADAVDAKGRRKRHKKPHHHRKHTGNHKGKHTKHKHRKHCKAESPAQTCADTCGAVRNNCKKTVDCGSCVCDPLCPVCQTCDETTGTCGPNPETVGDACDTCHTCNAAGECVSVTDDTSCDDGDACTQTDTCQGGVCVGGDPVVCQPLDQCHDTGTCDPDTGQCSNPAKSNGAACNDGDACTQTDTCQGGVCTGSNPVVCNSPNECQDGPGTCEPASGQCTYPAKADGTRCGDKCVQACINGTCGAGEAVVCNGCQLPGSCDPDTGQCAPDPATQHTCVGSCPSGQWCDDGACASIQDTVTIPECGSRCTNGADIATAEICGQTVTCPSCALCQEQTGCTGINFLPDGPLGSGQYCSLASPLFGTCTTNSDCGPGDFCSTTADPDLCARICPF